MPQRVLIGARPNKEITLMRPTSRRNGIVLACGGTFLPQKVHLLKG